MPNCITCKYNTTLKQPGWPLVKANKCNFKSLLKWPSFAVTYEIVVVGYNKNDFNGTPHMYSFLEYAVCITKQSPGQNLIFVKDPLTG